MQEYILFQEYSVLIFLSEPVYTCAYNRARTSKLTQNRPTIHEQFCLSEMKQLLAKIVTGYNLSQVVNDVIFWLLYVTSHCFTCKRTFCPQQYLFVSLFWGRRADRNIFLIVFSAEKEFEARKQTLDAENYLLPLPIPYTTSEDHSGDEEVVYCNIDENGK